ncbi:MAG: helix-turn-helix transcriptional regulator [Butyrivibrio sp.]|nr:helix-turn-helix transcriptional regulator [Butyrivibrio sp.]
MKLVERIINLKIRYINYKYRVLLFLMFIVTMVIAIGCGYYFKSSFERQETRAAELSKSSIEQISEQVSGEMDRIYNYYLVFADMDEVTYLVDNNIDYSDYSHIDKARNSLNGNNIVSEYVKGYSFINFNTGWVLSSKGMYKLNEASNIDEITELFDYSIDAISKNYWLFLHASNPEKLERTYRTTVAMDGLNLILKLPRAYGSTKAMIIVNVDTDAITRLALDAVSEGQSLTITNDENEIIYASDYDVANAIINSESELSEDISVKGDKYLLSFDTSKISELNFYVTTKSSYFETVNPLYAFFVVIIIALFSMMFTFLSFKWIYKPVDTMVHKISDANDNKLKPGEDELQYIAESMEQLSGSNTELHKGVSQLFQRRLLQGELSVDEINDYLERLSLNGKLNKFISMAFILKADSDERVISIEDEKKALYSIVSFIKQRYENILIMEPCYFARAIFALVEIEEANDDISIPTMIYNDVKEHIEGLNKGILLGTGVSKLCNDQNMLYNCYQESVLALNSGVVYDPEAEVSEQSISYCRFYAEYESGKSVSYNKSFEDNIHNVIMKGNKEEAYAVTDEFIRFLQLQNLSREENVVFLIQYVNAILLGVKEHGIDPDAVFKEPIIKIYQNVTQYYDLSRIRRYIKSVMIDPVIDKISNMTISQAKQILDGIMKLIDEKQGDITLTECAEALGYHPTYLWKVLKQEKDMSFTDYVEEYKINLAKNLLEETDMTVTQIAAKLNYTNAQNFIRFFSKKVGTTPGKYRQEVC